MRSFQTAARAWPESVFSPAACNCFGARISRCCMSENSEYSQVVELLRAESEAIAKAAARLSADDLDRVLSILTKCDGKIVLLGVGKSGIIAQKIAATMTSSGTAAINLHPSDALHGGLGIVNSGDVVIML